MSKRPMSVIYPDSKGENREFRYLSYKEFIRNNESVAIPYDNTEIDQFYEDLSTAMQTEEFFENLDVNFVNGPTFIDHQLEARVVYPYVVYFGAHHITGGYKMQLDLLKATLTQFDYIYCITPKKQLAGFQDPELVEDGKEAEMNFTYSVVIRGCLK